MAQAARQTFLSILGDVTLTSPTSGQALTYNGSAWVNGSAGVTAHSALTGLSADDHTQYLHNAPGTDRNLITPPDSTFPALQLQVSSEVNPGTLTTDNLLIIGPNGLTSSFFGVKSNGRVAINRSKTVANTAQVDISPDSSSTVGLRLELPASYATSAIDVRDSGSTTRFKVAPNTGASYVDVEGYGSALRFSGTGISCTAPFTMAHVFTAGTSFNTSSTGFVVKGQSGQTVPVAYIGRDNNTAGAYTIGFRSKTSTTSDVVCAILDADWGTTTHASRAGRLTLSVVDATATREGFRMDTDGSGANLSLFGAGSYASGRNVVFITNCAVAPSGTPSGGGVLYVESGALKYKGSSGTVTTLAAA